MSVNDVWSIDPRTGREIQLVAASTSMAEVDAVAAAAWMAERELVAFGRAARAGLLRRLAAALEERSDKLIRVADRESALGAPRLTAELARTIGQLRLFADTVEDGSYQEIVTTPALTDLDPPVPDLRRMLIPVGPVVVFGASNFPFAFSVLGGDTTAALAAGCPVVVKCHSGHPETSVLTMEAWRQAAAETGAPEDAVQLVFGRTAGRQLVQHPRIKAVAFTGSLAVGRELHDLAAGRPDPVPFYGELAGVNPLVVTPGAARDRGEEIGAGVVASFTLNGGQFCTKPGLLFVPAGPDGDRVVATAGERVAELQPAVMLTAGTQSSYQAGLQALVDHPHTRTVARVPDVIAGGAWGQGGSGGYLGTPALLEVMIGDVDQSVLNECFGPVAVAVRYESVGQVIDVLEQLEGSLAAAVHTTEPEAELATALTKAVLPKVGRVVYNGFPTGVAVTAAMTHGGPWPATTNALHSSVGPTSIRRFLRPVTFQNAPQAVLPAELRDVDEPVRG